MAEDWTAPKLLEMTGSYWQGCAIMAGVELDVFNLLDSDCDTSSGLAQRIQAEPRALEMLLRALAALGLLDLQEDRYTPSLAAKCFLVSESEQYMGNIISHQHHLVESWANLHEAVLSGGPVRKRENFAEESWRKSFLLGMQNLANMVAPLLVPRIELGGRRTLLDLGGGPGTWSIHFCRHNPQLLATIYDLATSGPYANEAIKNSGLADRIDFYAGDFNLKPLPEANYEVVWMSHILHGEGEQNCRKLIAKAAEALTSEGILVIHEFILDDDGPGPEYASLFALNMLLGTESGTAYREEELRIMIRDAGLNKIERLPLPAQSRSGILIASA